MFVLYILFFTIYFRITNDLTYYALTFTSSTLAGNRYLNYFLMAIMEFPPSIIMFFLINRYVLKNDCVLNFTITSELFLTS